MKGFGSAALLLLLVSSVYAVDAANLGENHAIEQRQAPPCPLGCTKEWNPVCGSDGITYGNNCSLLSADCLPGNSITFAHNGEC